MSISDILLAIKVLTKIAKKIIESGDFNREPEFLPETHEERLALARLKEKLPKITEKEVD